MRESPTKPSGTSYVSLGAMEQPRLLAGLEVHLVEERPRALGRGTFADEVDRIAVLEDRRGRHRAG